MSATAPVTAEELLALVEGLKRKAVTRLQELADSGRLEAYTAEQPMGGDG